METTARSLPRKSPRENHGQDRTDYLPIGRPVLAQGQTDCPVANTGVVSLGTKVYGPAANKWSCLLLKIQVREKVRNKESHKQPLSLIHRLNLHASLIVPLFYSRLTATYHAPPLQT